MTAKPHPCPRSQGSPRQPGAPPAFVPPRRISLVDQTVEALRALIDGGHWGGTLPGEEELRGQLGISRVTLRKALAVAAAQGWVTPGGRGCKHVISHAAVCPPTPGRRAVLVKCLSPVADLNLVWSTRVILDEVRKALLTRGFHWEFEHHAGLWRGNPSKRLGELTAAPAVAGWILYRASRQIQQWFQERRIPCVVMGPCHEGVTLPGAQVDVEALGRHAAAEASRLGHRHIAYVVFDPAVASSINTLRGLQQLRLAGGKPGRVSLIADDETVAGMRRSLASIMTGTDPATQLMVTGPGQALSAQGILREMGLRVPEDVSLIVRDHEPILKRSVPVLCRYAFDWHRMGRTAGRLLADVIASGGGLNTQRRLLPEFIRGETLARRRKD